MLRHTHQVVVMELIVLNVPCLHKHPVEPVSTTPPHASHSKRETAELALRAFVEPAMADVMPNDRPTCHRAHAHEEDRQRVDYDPACECPEPRAKSTGKHGRETRAVIRSVTNDDEGASHLQKIILLR